MSEGRSTQRRGRDHLRVVEPVPSAGRVPPHDLDAEGCVLAVMMLDETALLSIFSVLRADSFYSDANRRIFEAGQELFDNKQPVDVQTVKSWLKDREWLNQVGGPSYIVQLVDTTPSVRNVLTYAKIVAEKAQLRQLIGTCQRIAAEGYGDIGNQQAFFAGVAASIAHVTAAPSDDTRASSAVAVDEAMAQFERMSMPGDEKPGIKTPSLELNMLIGGFQERELTMLGGTPGAGKTSFMNQVATDCSNSSTLEPWIGDICQLASAKTQNIDPDWFDMGKPLPPGMHRPTHIRVRNGVLIFSQEAPRVDLTTKNILSVAMVDNRRPRNNMLDMDDHERIIRAATWLRTLPVEIDEQRAIRAIQMRARTARVVGEMAQIGVRLRLVCDDYVQCHDVSDQARHEKDPNRERQLAGLATQFLNWKTVPNFWSIAWLFLVQLNKGGDIRESQALEAVADSVLILDGGPKPAPIHVTHVIPPKPIQIITKKHRVAPPNSFAATLFHGMYGRFSDSEHLEALV